MDPTDLSIKSLIRAVTAELVTSRNERLSAGEKAIFDVSELTIEVSFVVTTSAHGSGGFDLKVIKADAGAQYDKQSVQKITLTLTAADQTDEPKESRRKDQRQRRAFNPAPPNQ